MTKILQISDGTTTIDLLDTSGIFLLLWNPNPASYKDGGLFRESVISPGRVPVYRQDANIVDTIILGISGASQSAVIAQLSALNLLLRNAYDYWRPGAPSFDPVYIVSKANNETNTKYAVIYKGEVTNYTDLYTGPFEGGVIVNGYGKVSGLPSLNLIVEHSNWRSHPPAQSVAVPTSVVETFNSVNYGNVNSSGTREETSTADEVFVSSKYSPANITHVYRFDSSGASFSSNLVSASLPYELFPSPAGNGDILYCGISLGVTGWTPFHSLIFNIGSAAAGTYDDEWEYWNGAAWTC